MAVFFGRTEAEVFDEVEGDVSIEESARSVYGPMVPLIALLVSSNFFERASTMLMLFRAFPPRH